MLFFCFQRLELIKGVVHAPLLISDGAEDESDDYEGNLSLRSLELDPCISTNELR